MKQIFRKILLLVFIGTIVGGTILASLIAVALYNTYVETMRKNEELTNSVEYLNSQKTEPTEQAPTPQPVYIQQEDTDPVITCISTKCGNKQVRKSVCDTSTCCELSSGWKWANSATECDATQTAEYEREDRKFKEEKERLDEGLDSMKESVKKIDCSTSSFKAYMSCDSDCLNKYGIGSSGYTSCNANCNLSKEIDYSSCLYD